MTETERQEEVKRLLSPSKQQAKKPVAAAKTSPAKKQLNLFEIKSTLLDDEAAAAETQAADVDANPMHSADTEPEEDEPAAATAAHDTTSDSTALDFHLEMSQSMNQSTISSELNCAT